MVRVWSKEITTWICGLISSDGGIQVHKGNRKSVPQLNITILWSSEIEWLENVKRVLINNQIGTSLYNYKTLRPFAGDKNRKYWRGGKLALNKRHPKGYRSGADQYQHLRNSIECHELQDFIIKRKYDNLCQFTKKYSGSPLKQNNLSHT